MRFLHFLFIATWMMCVSSGIGQVQLTWMAGSKLVNPNQYGEYGSFRQSAPANIPGGRQGGTTWVGNDGNLYLFGGYGFASTGAEGGLNDLWRYNPAVGQWTWLSGSNLVDQANSYGTRGTPSGGYPGE